MARSEKVEREGGKGGRRGAKEMLHKRGGLA